MSKWWLFPLLLTILLLTVLLLWQWSRASEPCPTKYGNYGVEPGWSGQPLLACGSTGQEQCTFGVQTLVQATQLCDRWPDLCQQFTYDQINHSATWTQLDQPLTPSNNLSTFRRQ